jgi:hypothetical protein
MRKSLLLFTLFIGLSLLSKAQTTLILQPDETASKDAMVWDYQPNNNFGTFPDFTANAWTHSGTPTVTRSLIAFDISSIPANSTIISATLSLYYYNSGNTIGHSQSSGSDACWLRRITSSWSESTVTWNNLPSTTTVNQVNIPASGNDTASYPNINVTALITDIYNNPTTSDGMMLELQTEQYYRSLLFASSNNSNPALRPRISITYQPQILADTCIVLRPGPGESNDALIWDYMPNNNYGTHPDFTGNAWTSGITGTIGRCMINFDFSSIPSNAIITSALLNLYHWNSPNTIGHSTTSGSNDCWLRRITSAWTAGTVTWNTQPTYTTVNQVHLAASINDTMNYPNIDMTNLITDIWNNQSTSWGFMIMLNTESYYRSLLFASGDCADATKRPLLRICYHIPASISDNQKNQVPNISVFPNPASDNITVACTTLPNNAILSIYNMQGQLLLSQPVLQNKTEINISSLAKGIYYIKLSTQQGLAVKKFVKE